MQRSILIGVLTGCLLGHPGFSLSANAQAFNVGPNIFVDSTIDIDWSNEAEFLAHLQQAATDDLGQLNDTVAQNLLNEVRDQDVKWRIALGFSGLGTALGLSLVVVGARNGQKALIIAGAPMLLFSVPPFIIAGNYFSHRRQVASPQELKEILGEQLADRIQNIGKILNTAYSFLLRKKPCLEVPESLGSHATIQVQFPKGFQMEPEQFNPSNIPQGYKQHCYKPYAEGALRQVMLQKIFTILVTQLNMAQVEAKNIMASNAFDDTLATLSVSSIVLPGVVFDEIRSASEDTPVKEAAPFSVDYELPLAELVEISQNFNSDELNPESVSAYLEKDLFIGIRHL